MRITVEYPWEGHFGHDDVIEGTLGTKSIGGGCDGCTRDLAFELPDTWWVRHKLEVLENQYTVQTDKSPTGQERKP